MMAQIKNIVLQQYDLKLYISGMTTKSMQALAQVKAICEKYLAENYQLEVIDIYQQPELAKIDEVIVVPTLVRKTPLPMRRFTGDLSNDNYILSALDLS